MAPAALAGMMSLMSGFMDSSGVKMERRATLGVAPNREIQLKTRGVEVSGSIAVVELWVLPVPGPHAEAGCRSDKRFFQADPAVS